MGTYLMMSGDTVSNIIAADDKESTEQALQCVLIEFDPQNPVGIGWTITENGWQAPIKQDEEE